MSVQQWIRTKLHRLVPVVAVLGVLLGGAVTVSVMTAAPALASTGGYPYYNAPCEFGSAGGSSCENPDQTDYPGDEYDWYENGGNPFSGSLCWYGTNSECFDPWGYEYRNCTSFVAWKLTSQGVAPSKVEGLQNGGDWYNNAPVSERSLTPAAGDAAVQPPTSSNPFGHVAYVDSVSGSNITIEEYNYAGTGAWDTRTGTPSALGFSEFVNFGLNLGGGGSSSDYSVSGSRAFVNPSTNEVYGFAISSNGDLWDRSDLNGWASWQDLGNGGESLTGSPSAFISPTTGELYVFAISSNGDLWDRSDLNGWASWQDLGNGGESLTGSPSAFISPTTGELYVFAISSNGDLWDRSDLNGWASWQDLGNGGESLTGSPSAFISPTTGELYVFAISSNGDLWDRSDLNGWASWQDLGNGGESLTGSPSAFISPTTGELYVFAISSNGDLWDRSDLNGWASWQDLGNGGESLTG